MANTLLTPDKITKEAMRILENNLAATKGVNRQYSSEFAQEGAKVGDTVRIRKPVRWVVNDGATLVNQDATDEQVPMTLDKQKHIAFRFTSKELTLSIDEFAERYLRTAMASLANQVDFDVLSLYKYTHASVGTAATPPTTLETFSGGKVKMLQAGTPKDDLISAIVDAPVEANLITAGKTLFHAGKEIEAQYRDGSMGRYGGMKFSMDQNVNTHTNGQRGGTPLINGATATGATSIVTDGWTAAAANRVKAGDVFTLAGVYAVNPQNKQSTGVLQQFVATADVASDGSGNATIPISPPIYGPTSNGQQNVSALPADDAALTFYGAASAVSPQHMIYHRDAFALASADLERPQGVDFASVVSSERVGLSIRIVRQYDISNDRFPCRLDILYGVKALYPELACRVWG